MVTHDFGHDVYAMPKTIAAIVKKSSAVDPGQRLHAADSMKAGTSTRSGTSSQCSVSDK
jgi:hypothetical protein